MHETIDSINFAFDEEWAVQYERLRFLTIVEGLETQSLQKKLAIQKVVLEYLKLSPNSDGLINDFILTCLSMKSPNRLELAIDILSETKGQIVDFAGRYLDQDIARWTKLNPEKKFQPNDDYWYVLLRSIGKCGAKQEAAFRIISGCQDELTVGIGEAVVEALGDLNTPHARKLLVHISRSENSQFIRKMARDVLEDIAEGESLLK